jgi:hypothetical protein
MPDKLAVTLKDITKSHDGCSDIEFTISRLVNNKSWHKAIIDGMQEAQG